MEKSKKIIFAFIIISLIQVTIIIFWGLKKENLYWDEFYTLEGAHYFSASNGGEHYIDDDPDYKIGEWLPISYVKDTLIVGEKETLFNEPIVDIIKKLTGYHNYSAYLNLIESLLSLGKFSIWPAIILNIIFFVFNQLILFAMCKGIANNEIFALIVCSMYGFSSICISMAVFIRCYMLATMLVTLFTYLHFLYYESDGDIFSSRFKRIAFLMIVAMALYTVHNIAQYSVVYGGVLVIAFSILLLIKKGAKRFFCYSIPIFGGGLVYLYTQTDYLHILINLRTPNNDSNTALATTLDGIVNFRLSFLPERLMDMLYIIGRYQFGSFFVMITFVIVAFTMIIVHKIVYFKTSHKERISQFAIIIAIATLLYITIFTVFGLYEQVRYISFVFPELAILTMLVAYNAFRTDKYKYACVLALIIVEIFLVNVKGKVDMIYPGDKESIERIRDFGADSYILHAGKHRTLITYETAFVAEDDDEFFVYDDIQKGELENLKNKLRDKMILVGYYGESTQDVQDMLRENGYQVDWIADTYNYVFYSATRN